MVQQHNDEHLTIEQLSSLIDEQVSPSERTSFHAHLQSCDQCQQNLNSLRRTSMLLRALPQPALPRSFVLPLDTVQDSAPPLLHPRPRPAVVTPFPPSRRQQAWTRAARSTVRAVSTLAAVVGLVFLLSGLYTTLNLQTTTSFSTAASGTNDQARAPLATTPSAPTPKAARSTPATDKPTKPATTSGSNPQPTPVPSTVNPHDFQHGEITTTPLLDLSQPEGRLALGAVLVLLSAIGILATRRRQPRSNRTSMP